MSPAASRRVGALSMMLPPEGTVGDGSINTDDTHFVVDLWLSGSIDINSDDSFWDPASQTYTNVVTVPFTPEQNHLEGGYDYNGNTLYDHWSGDDGAQGSGVALTHVNNDYVTMYDPLGNPIADDGTQDLIGMTGSLINGVDPTQLVIGVSGGGPDNCPNNKPLCEVLQQNILPPVASGAAEPPPSQRRGVWTNRGTTLEYTYTDDNIASPEALGDVDHLSDGPSPVDTIGGTHTLRSTKAYRKQGQTWVLDHTDEVTTHQARGFTMTIRRHADYRNVRALWNAKNEKKRDSIRALTKPQRPHGVEHRPLPSANVPASGFLGLGGSIPEIRTSGNVLAPLGHSNATVPRVASDLLFHPAPAASHALVLQHGIFSSEGTWTSYMSGQLTGAQMPPYLQFSTVFIPSLASTDPLESQVTDLGGACDEQRDWEHGHDLHRP